MYQPDEMTAGIEVPAWDAEQQRVTCVCGASLRLVKHGAAPMVDSSGGPYVTYGEWRCDRCGKTWLEDEYDGWRLR